MKILFVGTMVERHHSGWQRVTAMRQIGHEIVEVSMAIEKREPSNLIRLGRLLPASLNEALLGPGASRADQMIVEAASRAKPEIIWLEWPKTVSAATIKKLKQDHPKAKIVSYQDDNPFGNRKFASRGWQRFFDAIPFYDLHFVKRESDVKNYQARGAKNVKVQVTGYSEELFYPETQNPWPNPIDVIFVGTALEDRRAEFLEALVGLGVDVQIYGNRWDRTELYKKRPDLCLGKISEDDYRRAVSAAKISLGFVSHSNMDEYTGRLFELPACGTMFLGESTELQKGLMAPDREAVYFTSIEDWRDKIAYYLSNEPARKAIADAGHKRALEFGFRHRMKAAIDTIQAL